MDASSAKDPGWGMERTALADAKWPDVAWQSVPGRTPRDLVALYLDGNRELIEKSGQATLQALAFALEHRAAIPRWLTDVFVARFRRFSTYESRTLDEAFEVPPLKPRIFDTHKRWNVLRRKVSDALEAALRADPDRAIGGELFAEVADQLGISRSYCEDLYRAAVFRLEQDDLKDFRDQLHVVGGDPAD